MTTPTQVQLEADLHAMIADMPVAVTFGDQEVDCSRSVRAITETGEAAGELAGYRFSLHSVLSDWTPVPVEGDLLTVGGVEYRVLRLNDDSAGVRFDMGAKFRERGGSEG
jgi:hypothetical protein